MNALKLILLVCILATVTFISGPVALSPQINANTPTTSELPATVGNESNSDLGLSNSTVPAENTTTVTPVSPI
ncbi:MAG: hypothetical protein H0W19_01260 [Nitrosopumilus sp.]|nr:hypothetical protein [Nitrosopumilus sp.]